MKTYHNDHSMKVNPNDLINRLKTCSLAVIGELPSDKKLLRAMMLHLTDGKSPDSFAMVELARTLFGKDKREDAQRPNGLELAHESV